MADLRTRGACVLFSLLLISGCQPKAAADDPRDPSLSDYARVGAFTDPELIEASGLVRSSREDNVFWAQNDSGNDERIFAFDSTGRALGAVRVSGARNRDWEAIALGACESGSCLFVGDVGDNSARHETVRVWRIAEPLSTDTVSPPARELTFRFVDGPQDVESMWVAPDSALLFLTKRPARRPDGSLRPARIYRVPVVAWRTSQTAVASLVDSITYVPETGDNSGWITDAALSDPDSSGQRRLAVRTYREVLVFDADSVTGLPHRALARCSLRQFKNSTGEGLTWLPGGRLFFDAEGAQAKLHRGRCP